MRIKNITICGLGTLGEQIAFHIAFCKFHVIGYDIQQQIIKNAKEKFILLGEIYKAELNATQEEIDETISRISVSNDLAAATSVADLIIESIPENLQIKKTFYKALDEVAPAKSIFCTNSSTLLPSMFADDIQRPERLLALHFMVNIWKYNIAEIMGHTGTDSKVFELVVAFAKEIKMITIPIYKEHPGYIFNSLLIPFLKASLSLYLKGFSDPQTIDRTWMGATGSPVGPFGILDGIGITTMYNVVKTFADDGDRDSRKVLKFLQTFFIEKGKLGISTGEGFYTYPNPLYESHDFLKN